MALIYIVEDDNDIAEIEQIALRNAGCEVRIFNDGRSFFKQLLEKIPELVLIDRNLPDINGCEIVKLISRVKALLRRTKPEKAKRYQRYHQPV